MLKIQIKTAGLLALLALCSVSAAASDASKGSEAKSPLTAVAALDVPRYMGVWYEIAKFPNWFQRKCVRATHATYALRSDGQVQVTNRCQTDSGAGIEAVGLARQMGPATSPKLGNPPNFH